VNEPGASRLPLDEGGGLVVLVDPGRTTPDQAHRLARRAAESGACGFLVGDSLGRGDVGAVVAAIREGAPSAGVIQFPASADELSADVDAVLFLTLLSGRNPRYLVEEQVRAAAFFLRHRSIHALSTAYLLIDGGRVSAVERVTGTHPLPADRPDVVAAHVKAGHLMGMRATYLEAGSGAARPVAEAVIAAAREVTDGPLFVGGGISSPAAARAARRAGADYVVVGTLFEREPALGVGALATAARA
jgi:geranylgeranylglyceryl phosphate synthase family protein